MAKRATVSLTLLITALLCMILLDTISNHIVSALVSNYQSRHYTIVPNRDMPVLYDTSI